MGKFESSHLTMDEAGEINDIFDDDLDNMIEGNESADENGEINTNLNDEHHDSTQTAKLAEVKKRVIRRPRVTLNAERLCGKQGIAILPKTFENIKFRGKGHEKENLDKLMFTLKHWSYRLFPSMCFDDVLETIERLGTKRPVQVCLRKIRLDMPVLSDDFIKNDDDDDNINCNDMAISQSVKNGENNHVDSLTLPQTSKTVISEEAFDELFRQHEQYMEERGINEKMEIENALINDSPMRTPNILCDKLAKSLTKEQQERIEKNERLARERRALLKSSHDDNLDEKAVDNLIESNTDIIKLSDIHLTSIGKPNFSKHNEFEVTSIKESNFNVDSEITAISEQYLTKHNDHEVMFSSEESNDDIKFDISSDALLGYSE